jgi:hypothetical protein
MKLQSLLLLGVLIFSVVFANAQSDDNAKGLYFGYKPRPRAEREKQRRQTTTTTTTTTRTERTERTTTTVSTNRTNSGNSNSGNRNRPNNTTVARNNSSGVSPSETGLPGTKITIELMRDGKHSFVKPTYKFRSGDQIRIRMKTNFEGFVSVLNLGSSGKVNLLYPVQGRDNYVMPTQDYQIPQGDGWIIFDDQPGTEIVSVIMSEDELQGLNSLNNNSDYFRKDRTSKDLFVQTSGNDFYAVFRQQNIGENFGFTLKLKHKK